MKYLSFLFLLSTVSCTNFHKLSTYTKTEPCTDKKPAQYECVINDSLHFKYVSFGGFKFANSSGKYRKFKIKNKPHFKNIILFGSSEIINTNYYILLNNKIINPDFEIKDTLIAGNKLNIAINKKANNIYKKFLINGFNHVNSLEE